MFQDIALRKTYRSSDYETVFGHLSYSINITELIVRKAGEIRGWHAGLGARFRTSYEIIEHRKRDFGNMFPNCKYSYFVEPKVIWFPMMYPDRDGNMRLSKRFPSEIAYVHAYTHNVYDADVEDGKPNGSELAFCFFFNGLENFGQKIQKVIDEDIDWFALSGPIDYK